MKRQHMKQQPSSEQPRACLAISRNSKATKPVQPSDGPLDHPTRLPQAAAVFGSALGDLGLDSVAEQGSSVGIGVIASVPLEPVWA